MRPRSQGSADTEETIIAESSPVVDPTTATAPDPKPATNSSLAEAARAKAAELIAAGDYTEARKSLEEADTLEANADVASKAEAARAKAAQYMAERRFGDAKKALDDADAFEAETKVSRPQALLKDMRGWVNRLKPARSTAAAKPEAGADGTGSGAVDESLAIVSLYSKIAAGVGLLPGGLLNFAAILAVQVTMVWKIANKFGQKEGKERIRGSVMSLIGSVVPTSLGHGAGAAVLAIPAVIAGTVVYFLVTPVLAYAMTQAVGNAYIMHFESGGTLLTFDARAFGEHFLKEFQNAGGSLKTELQQAPASQAA